MIRVLVIDDHPLVYEGLRQVLAGFPDLELVGHARNGDEGLAMIRAGGWDVALLDLSMPGKGGLEVLFELQGGAAVSQVLVLSMHAEEHLAVRALRSGAAGYITKDCDPDELVRAVRQVAAGRRYVGGPVAEALADRLQRNGEGAAHEQLSDREYEVLCLIAAGRSLKEIGAQLTLAESTVSTYRARVLEKLRLSTTAELVRYALEHKLVE